MNEIRLIIDSSSNERSNQENNLRVVPLTVTLSGVDYRDDDSLDLDKFLEEMASSKVAGRTTCPSIQEWLDALEGAEKAIIVTMTSGLSGTYSSALQAKDLYLEQHPTSQVIVVDSRSAGPELSVVLEEIKQLVMEDKRFVDLDEEIAKLRTKTHLLFILQSLHNLSLNGRISPAVAKVAEMLHINVLGTASMDGKFEQLSKARGMKKTLRDLLKQMDEFNYQGGRLIIDHCNNQADAEKVRDMILGKYPKAQITIRPMGALCSFYAEEGGLMLGFIEG
ncbi:DegV family protein [Lactobacillus pasteurii DSM 23907 = CRBIP 24.76]|uniref:DegV family protein n=1 Tax=Lactobacillus pasteurii DSM 23907 = CRBIP 24.76 TaxID=1423790 RepID=I7KLY3_9LACO|nr:DegV family protein [Lactobacillus pasteurii]KRK08474.1 DegV family protein [Lactobacillus pasteurii DSM 23907 = CRBIP 24.76]TDG75652.1 hypothetical protein C5L33_000537 [Lactobacillus pasteurii]CCI85669.1 DegV family protein [Lactobacillus pasteurii DSM 23907 = CRBIP 24.76]